MGIDLYARWEGMTKDEKEAQYTGFAGAGEAGYIREAYHGDIYATRVLIPEAFEDAAFGADNRADDDRYGALVARSETDPPSDFEGQPRVLLPDFLARREAALEAARQRGLQTYGGDKEYAEDHAKEVDAFITAVDARVSEGAIVRIQASY